MRKLVAIALGVALAGVGTVALATRNSSGTYSLPSGNPVTSGTSISSTWANNTLGDIGQSLTDSLDRNGKGGMLAPLRTPNGSVTAPTHSFTNDTDSGLYLVGDAQPAMTVAGTKRQEWTSAGTAVTGTFSASGNTTVGGTLGVTGAATLAATPVLQAGATISGGNLSLSLAGTQGIAKSGGTLTFGTTDANQTQFLYNGNLVASINSIGFDNANRPINSVATPTNATDAANKTYVDTNIRLGRPVFAVLINGTNGSVLRVADGSTSGYVFARSSAGVYTITKAGGYAANPFATVSAQSTTGTSASWYPTSGTVMTLYVSGGADANLSVAMYD